MTPKQQVPTLETCRALEVAGWKQGSTLFSWAYDNLQYGKEFTHEVVKIINRTNPVENMHRIVDAPTVQELLEVFAKEPDWYDEVDTVVLHCWTEKNVAEILAEMFNKLQKRKGLAVC